MRKSVFLLFFLILLGGLILKVDFVYAMNADNLSTEDLEKFIHLNNTDTKNILRNVPQALTDAWIESVVSVASAEEEAVNMIVRKSVRDDIRDYLLIEGPKEVGIEIVKMGYKIGKMVLTKNIGEMIKEIEKLTVKEAVNYLGQWLKEREIKVATGNLDFSYDNFQGKKEKQQFQYVILYYPKTDAWVEAVIKIFSSKPIGAPDSRGSWGSALGTAWNYSNDYAQGKKIAPFILTIRGEMERVRSGYWQGEITHRYSWRYQPDIELEFPDSVPYFDFREKGFFENLGDKIKGFFGKISDFFSGASLVEVPDREKNPDGTLDLSADSALRGFIDNILEQFNNFKSFLGQAEYSALEKQAEDIITEEDLLAFMEKIESLQKQLDALGEKIDLLQAQGAATSSEAAELNSEQNQQTQTGKNILINEVCAGFNKAENEFIELYNPNDAPVELDDSNFQLQLVNSGDNITKKKITWTNNIIPTKGYFLLTAGELVIDGKKIQSDAVFSSQLSSVSGAIIGDDKEGNVFDKVSWGKPEQSPPQSAAETQGKILEKGLETNKSLERSDHIDTNNNTADFSLNESPSPANSLGEKFIYTAQGQNNDGSNDEEGESNQSPEDSGQNQNQNIFGGGSSPTIAFCSQQNLANPAYAPILINEVAWMGSQEGHIKEWIELKNISGSAMNLEKWQLLDKAENVRVIFGAKDNIPAGGFYLLERNDDEAVPSITADVIYTGALANSNESLRLFNSNCDLIDEAIASPDWPAGDNETKQTMERAGSDLSWHNYSGPGSDGILGTPSAENSEIDDSQGENNSGDNDDGGENESGNGDGNDDEGDEGEDEGEGEDEDEDEDDIVFAQGLIITEVLAAGNQEFIEIHNPLDQEISLAGLYFSYFSANREWNNPFLNKEFPTSTLALASKDYFLIGMGEFPESESDWKPYQAHLSDDNGGVGLFSCDPSQATTTPAAIDCKIDALGWGESLVFESQSATSSNSKSLARKLTPDSDGYLRYADTNDNSNDFEEQEPSPGQRNFSPYSDLDDDGIIDEYDPLTEISSDIILLAGEYVFKNLTILQGFNLFAESDVLLGGFKGVRITADNININESAGIVADYNGYPSDQGPGTGAASQTGASYGGFGGRNEGEPKLFIYGDLENPTELGSGALGNPEVPGLSLYRAGGAGGGAIILDIQGELLNNGVISANGENGASHNFGGPASTGAGSGGSINIATGILSGSGIIRANGGHSSSGSGAGGGGRVAFYYDTNSFSGNIEVFGGKDEDGSHHGGAGTIFISQGSGLGDLIVNNNNQSGKTLLVEEVYSFNDVVIENGVNFYLPNQLVSVNLIVKNSALTAPDNTGMNISDTFNLNNSRIIGQNQGTLTIEGNNIILTGGEIEANVLVQSNSLLIDSGSTVSSTGLGYLAEEGLGAGIIGYGGSYGGLGGRNYPSSGFGQPYGNEQMPDYFGSGGGNGSAVRKGGSGGGKIEIISAGEIAIDGAISSNGNNGVPHITSYPSSGAGSGGAVYISANIISGAGIISANGGLASSASGGGGGGRVAIYGNMDNFIGIVEALGGINFENALHDGKDGTVFLSP